MKLAVETLLPKPKPPRAVVPLRSRKNNKNGRGKMHKDCAMPCHCQDIALSLPCHAQVAMSLAYCHVVAMVAGIAHCGCGVIAMSPRTRIVTPAAGPCPKATSAAVERAPSPETRTRPKHATAAPSAATQGTVSQAQRSRSAGARAVPALMAAALLTALRVACHHHPCCSHRRRCRRCRRRRQ